MNFSGCFVAIITPMRGNQVDYDALTKHASWLVDEGVCGVVVCGTTGESATLTDDEKIRCTNTVMDAVGDRATVVAGAGNNCTHESLDFIELANRQARTHALMPVVPYYNKPPQDGIIAHFEAIADASRFPLMIYNVPGRTVVSMTVETMAHLTRHTNIVAIKEASADLVANALLFEAVGDHAAILSGDDGTAMPFIAAGGDGVVSVVGNVAPRIMSAMCEAAASGDRTTASTLNSKIARLHNLMFSAPNPMPAKAACSHLGFCTAEARLPITELDDASKSELFAQLDALEITR